MLFMIIVLMFLSMLKLVVTNIYRFKLFLRKILSNSIIPPVIRLVLIYLIIVRIRINGSIRMFLMIIPMKEKKIVKK